MVEEDKTARKEKSTMTTCTVPLRSPTVTVSAAFSRDTSVVHRLGFFLASVGRRRRIESVRWTQGSTARPANGIHSISEHSRGQRAIHCERLQPTWEKDVTLEPNITPSPPLLRSGHYRLLHAIPLPLLSSPSPSRAVRLINTLLLRWLPSKVGASGSRRPSDIRTTAVGISSGVLLVPSRHPLRSVE